MFCNFESCNKIIMNGSKTDFLRFKVFTTIKYVNFNRKMIILLRMIKYTHSWKYTNKNVSSWKSLKTFLYWSIQISMMKSQYRKIIY